MSHIVMLKNLGACTEGIEYASKYDTLQAAWDACENSSFMLWLLEKQGREKDLHRCACVFARSVLHLYEVQYPGDPRVQAAIECKERWIDGNATDEELGAAADAAGAAATAADAAWAAATAAWAAATAARAAGADAAAWAAATADAAWADAAATRDAQCYRIRSVVPCV